MRMLFSGLLLASALVASAQAAPRLRNLPGKHETARTVVLVADVACPPDEAYAMWATEAGVRSFYAPAAHIDGTVGGRYTIMFYPDEDPEGLVHGTAGAHLLAAEPGRFLAFEWITFAGADNKGAHAPPFAPAALRRPDPLPTWVEIVLTPTGAGTHVDFRHYGFGHGALWGRSQAWFGRAWAGVLEAMRVTCARAHAHS
ncbi:MAG: SRPBCC domain-containing protein [Sphingomonadaceae bacterium]|nr:SRPBCC domain-containing protein [Sphingomonadaceae bacterium]